MSKESLEVLARMTDTPIEVRDFVSKWLLLTYDLPHNEKGDKARRDFLLQARAIGATRHTDSVYVMPWTTTAESLALKLARAGGEVIVWTSSTTDESKAKEITKAYDRSIEPILDEISERIDRMVEYLNKNQKKRAYKMMEKTERMLNQVEQAVQRRGSMELYVLLTIIQKRFGTL